MYEDIKSREDLPRDPAHCGYKVWEPTRKKAREHVRKTLQGFVPYRCETCKMWHFRSKGKKHQGVSSEKTQANPYLKVSVWVWLRPGVKDSVGEKCREDLLGENVSVLRVSTGRYFELRIATTDPKEALSIASKAAQTLLANTVVERFEAELCP